MTQKIQNNSKCDPSCNNHERRDWRIFPSPSVPCRNCGGGDRWCRHLSSLQGISLRKIVLSPVWFSRQTTAVLLSPCHDEFRGPQSDYVRQQHEIYFQWIPSHIGLFGNDTADLLAKEGVTEDLMSRRTLTFSELFSKTKSLIQELWKTPPTHPWYIRQAPGGALSIKADRVVQTTISRLASGRTSGLSFHLDQEIYENCTKCNLVQATPDHLLLCAGLDREDIYSSPLLVYDFLRTLGLMDLV
ncbi:RNase H domain-containing protein [Trichonephila clavipes]|nr:RNase H domain-containing protein [Trichonephila clavipes]